MTVQMIEAGDHRDGHVALRVARLLGRGRDGVEADVGEEDDRRRARDAAEAVGRERRPVVGLHVERPDDHEEGDDDQLERHHRRVQPGALVDAPHEHPRDQGHDQEGRQVEQDVHAEHDRRLRVGLRRALDDDPERGGIDAARRRGRHVVRPLEGRPEVGPQPQRNLDAEAPHQLLEVPGPRDRHRHVTHGVLEDEVPADDPRDQLAERRVGVRVGGAGDRHHGRELRVAQRREPARHRHEQERDDQRRPGADVLGPAGRRRADRREDARADDGADAERGQLHRARASA